MNARKMLGIALLSVFAKMLLAAPGFTNLEAITSSNFWSESIRADKAKFKQSETLITNLTDDLVAFNTPVRNVMIITGTNQKPKAITISFWPISTTEEEKTPETVFRELTDKFSSFELLKREEEGNTMLLCMRNKQVPNITWILGYEKDHVIWLSANRAEPSGDTSCTPTK